ncbi:PrsW family intramembrane metalloprotease [Allokutzneria albata]|uniref:Membrane proteinase PrsW, cleaves anti-sigma factor RsiW, M82 family n=1 Tax=Allokutzneria albata TaxID=211114 RepID=A0A1H0AKZ0_ALLAB|nr:PrsW family intramembrane metalloprotease [Allokutzneria albata]SDN34252.1 Membrane proteinase PrsW, cleaves anti-sigma factor RsiW, M82 family [Allokutzneria albata]
MTTDELPAEPAQQRRQQRAVIGSVIGLILLGTCGLILLGMATSRVGLLAVLIGAGTALVPVGFVMGAFLWIDRWEPEPTRLLLAAFLWGACGATISALLINDSARAVGDLLLGPSGGDFLSSVVSAPLVEETAKALFPLALMLWRRHEFDGVVDGIVYAGVTAAGFAFTENIFYFGQGFAQGGFGNATSGVVAVFILRGVLSPFAHPLFTAMTGIGLGLAASSRRGAVRFFAPLLGFLLAISLHVLWNAAATLGGGLDFLDVYFLIMVPIFAGMIWLVVWQRRREQRIVVGQLPVMADAGWIAPSEVALLASMAGRRWWLGRVRQRAGEEAARAVAGYQTAVTELAFLRHRMANGTCGGDSDRRHAELLATLHRARAAAVNAPGALGLAGNRPARRPGRSQGTG